MVRRLVVFLAALAMLALRADDPATAPPPGTTNAAAPAPSPAPVQVDVTRLLNARVVTTLTAGKAVPLAIDIDGAGGIATAGAASSLGGDPSHAVPDDGVFPANGDHPTVVLHFSNADTTGSQVRRMPKPDDFSFPVPGHAYAKLLLFFTSGAAGSARLHITLTYQDGTKDDRDMVCPDWFKNLDGTNPDCVYLATNLAKWSRKNKLLEKDHHNIFALETHPAPDKVLTQVAVHKTRPLVCFWGATGVPAP